MNLQKRQARRPRSGPGRWEFRATPEEWAAFARDTVADLRSVPVMTVVFIFESGRRKVIRLLNPTFQFWNN